MQVLGCRYGGVDQWKGPGEGAAPLLPALSADAATCHLPRSACHMLRVDEPMTHAQRDACRAGNRYAPDQYFDAELTRPVTAQGGFQYRIQVGALPHPNPRLQTLNPRQALNPKTLNPRHRAASRVGTASRRAPCATHTHARARHAAQGRPKGPPE